MIMSRVKVPNAESLKQMVFGIYNIGKWILSWFVMYLSTFIAMNLTKLKLLNM